MYGVITYGFMSRSAVAFRLVCRRCHSISDLQDEQLPISLTLEECADLTRCPACGEENHAKSRTLVIEPVS